MFWKWCWLEYIIHIWLLASTYRIVVYKSFFFYIHSCVFDPCKESLLVLLSLFHHILSPNVLVIYKVLSLFIYSVLFWDLAKTILQSSYWFSTTFHSADFTSRFDTSEAWLWNFIVIGIVLPDVASESDFLDWNLRNPLLYSSLTWWLSRQCTQKMYNPWRLLQMVKM